MDFKFPSTKDNKTLFKCHFTNKANKRGPGPLQRTKGISLKFDRKKTEHPNACFCSDFSAKYRTSIHKGIQNPRVVVVLYEFNSFGLEGLYPKALRELKNEITQQPPWIYEKS